MKKVIAILILLTACQTDNNWDNEYAKTETYYFEITQSFSSNGDPNLASEVSELLGNKKYAITKNSGVSWPFFQAYDMNDEILRGDLMAPHTASHSLTHIKHQNDIINNDVKLNIVFLEQEGNYSFDMIKYKWENDNWVKVVDTGNHRISKNNYKSREELIQVIYKTIVRYSFK